MGAASHPLLFVNGEQGVGGAATATSSFTQSRCPSGMDGCSNSPPPSAHLHPSYTQLRGHHFLLSPMQRGRIIHSEYGVKQEVASQRVRPPAAGPSVRSCPVTTSAHKHPDRRSGYLSLLQVRGGLMNCCLEQFVLPLLLIAVPEKRSEGSAARC